MRAGQNPAKFTEEQSSPAERVTVALLTHIPYLQGYYTQSLDVLKASIASIEKHTELPYDLFVFDNASGIEVREYLQSLFASNRIQYLFFSSKNLGKGRAWDVIFGAVPGEIIAYADSDVYFGPGWLKSAIRMLETFPNVGMVTCRPMRTYPEGHSATRTWAEREPDVVLEEGAFIDWEIFREHDINLGLDEGEVRARYESSSDLLITYRGERALIGAAHWQFVAYRSVLQAFLPLGIQRPLGDDRKLDDAINQAGYLRLMTLEPFVRHLGNTLPSDLANGSRMGNKIGIRSQALSRRILDSPLIKRLLLGIYNRIFRWYFYR